MKTLILDIETSPNVVHTWGLRQQDVGLNQILETSRVLCLAAKWLGERKTFFWAEWGEGGRPAMLQAIHELLDEADVVMHYNGRRFDIPHLNREFLEAGMLPPSPFADIDLLLAVRRRFRFQSFKLDHVANVILGDGKVKHEGHTLWRKVLDGDELARKRMERYNKRDVTLLEELYEPLRPWIAGHPSAPLHDGLHALVCPVCSSPRVQRRGFAHTAVSRFQQYQCQACGKWFRGTKRVGSVAVTQVTAA